MREMAEGPAIKLKLGQTWLAILGLVLDDMDKAHMMFYNKLFTLICPKSKFTSMAYCISMPCQQLFKQNIKRHTPTIATPGTTLFVRS